MKTLKVSKPRINIAKLRRELKEVVRMANDMNFGCPAARNGFITKTMQIRGHSSATYWNAVELANLAGLRVENGVIFP